MTEHESEELYQELRRKLGDYGSQPSEEVWAGIRQQLPPMPVVAPARRQRGAAARSLAAVLLLGLALILTVVGTRQWRRPVGAKEQLAQRAEQRPAPQASSAGPALAATAGRPAGVEPAASQVPAVKPATPPAAATMPATTTERTAAAAASATAEITTDFNDSRPAPTVAAPGLPHPKRGVGLAASVAPTRRSKSARRFATEHTSSTQSATTARRATEANSSARSVVVSHPKRRRSSPAAFGPAELLTAKNQDSPRSALSQQNRLTTAATQLPGARSAAGVATTTFSATEPAAPVSDLAKSSTSQSRQPATAAAQATTSAQPAGAGTLAHGQPAWVWPLNLRSVQPGPAAFPLPAPLAGVPLDSARPKAATMGRWAVQLLAGPAGSYRQLGSPARLDSQSVARLERPGLGYSAQVSIQYAATPKLALGLGVSYTEFATRLKLAVPEYAPVYTRFTYSKIVFRNGRYDTLSLADSTATMRRSETRLVRQRDVYRFVALPVQLQYLLGTTGRLSYRAVLGGTVNFYVGGRTTEVGAACSCEQRTWGASGSPFRVASVGLLAGLGVEYRLTGRWQLLVQPTWQYMLTPVSRADAPYTRRPFALGLQAGVSLNLP